MNRPVRTGKDFDEARARILEAAEKLFRRVGYHRTSVADIATELGMSPANIYRFFPSRDAINESVCGRVVNEVADVASVVCHRGRSGFKLTEKGEVFYRLVVDFFQSMQSFELQAGELKGEQSGQLRLGFLDNIVADPLCPLTAAVSAFRSKQRGSAQISLDVFEQQELNQALLENKIDLAIGIFYSRIPGISYEPLYLQRDVMVCKKGHPLASIGDPNELAKAIPTANKVRRSFVGVQEFPLYDARTLISTIGHIEAATLLILSGDCVG